MIHRNPPPLRIIPTNPLQYNLSSTKTHNTKHSIYSLEHNTQTVTSNNSIQHHNVPVIRSISSSITTYYTYKPLLHLYHKFHQTLSIYKLTPHIQTII